MLLNTESYDPNASGTWEDEKVPDGVSPEDFADVLEEEKERRLVRSIKRTAPWPCSPWPSTWCFS